MKDEIKEYIKEQIDKCYVIEHKDFEKVDLSKLLDYITNLQEENERLSVELNKNMIERNNYLSRNKKAIEYIKEHNCIATNKEYKPTQFEYCCNVDLLNILQGEDKDE